MNTIIRKNITTAEAMELAQRMMKEAEELAIHAQAIEMRNAQFSTNDCYTFVNVGNIRYRVGN